MASVEILFEHQSDT